jgi:hypothetical protein
MVCQHDVSGEAGKPCLSVHMTAEPSGAIHWWLTAGTEDEPDDLGCREWGPFDDEQDVMSALKVWLVDWALRRNRYMGWSV